jgi:hypothetical protein
MQVGSRNSHYHCDAADPVSEHEQVSQNRHETDDCIAHTCSEVDAQEEALDGGSASCRHATEFELSAILTARSDVPLWSV